MSLSAFVFSMKKQNRFSVYGPDRSGGFKWICVCLWHLLGERMVYTHIYLLYIRSYKVKVTKLSWNSMSSLGLFSWMLYMLYAKKSGQSTQLNSDQTPNDLVFKGSIIWVKPKPFHGSNPNHFKKKYLPWKTKTLTLHISGIDRVISVPSSRIKERRKHLEYLDVSGSKLNGL